MTNEVKVHVRRWSGSSATESYEEEGGALLFGILEIDGTLIDCTEVRVEFKPDGFVTVMAVMIPEKVRIVHHNRGGWEQLLGRLRRRREKRRR